MKKIFIKTKEEEDEDESDSHSNPFERGDAADERHGEESSSQSISSNQSSHRSPNTVQIYESSQIKKPSISNGSGSKKPAESNFDSQHLE